VFDVLYTQSEVDVAVGSDRQRQRLEKRRELLTPVAIDGFGQRLRLFPKLTLAQILARQAPRAAAEGVVDAVDASWRSIKRTESFECVIAALREHLREIASPSLAGISEVLLGSVPEAYAQLSEEMERAVEELKNADIHFHAGLGCIVASHPGQLSLEMFDGTQLSIPRGSLLSSSLSAGCWAVRERVRVGGLSGVYITKAPTPSAQAPLTWKLNALRDLQVQAAHAAASVGVVDLPYAFLYDKSPGELQGWLHVATRQLLRAENAKDWESVLAEERAEYAAQPALAAEDRPTPTPDRQFAGQWDWQAVAADMPDPFARALPT
jgi:hypothetical protein